MCVACCDVCVCGMLLCVSCDMIGVCARGGNLWARGVLGG
jgi:hypothetical protein